MITDPGSGTFLVALDIKRFLSVRDVKDFALTSLAYREVVRVAAVSNVDSKGIDPVLTVAAIHPERNT